MAAGSIAGLTAGLVWPYFSKLLVHTAILPGMKLWWWVKNKAGITSDHTYEKFFLLITNRYIALAAIVIITLGVATSNVIASDNYGEYGQNAVLYKIAGKSDISIIEDTSSTQEYASSYRYNESTDLAYSTNFTESQRREDEVSRSQSGELVTNIDGSTVMKPELTSTEDSGAGGTTIRSYLVTDGDSIGKIASSFGISVNTILWANGLTFNSYIKPGQTLTIPPVNGVIHKVGSGDNLAKLAQRYDADEQKIRDFNRLDETGRLTIGETVMIPGGRIIDTIKPRTTARVATTPAGRSSTARVDSNNIVSSGKMLWPNSCRRITQNFRGWIHTGIDVACPWGVPIFAADDGVVTDVKYARTGYGYHVIIKHANGIETLYGHLSSISVEAGQRVSKGSVIGKEGSTGRSTGPHLHFEVRVGGARVNPLSYVR